MPRTHAFLLLFFFSLTSIRLHVDLLPSLEVDFSTVMMNSLYKFCELCGAHASTFCPSDEAFLCWSCDASVHQDNSLLARHVRKIICSKCKVFTENSVSGVCLPPQSLSLCAACSPVSESDCASSTLSCATSQRKNDADGKFNTSQGCSEVNKSSQKRSRISSQAERALMYWCMKLGLTGDRAVLLGKSALGNCCSQMSVFPFRVSLAASLLFGLKYCGDRSLYTCQTLKRLEEISGVQAKLISVAESKLKRDFKIVISKRKLLKNQQQGEEGYAESEGSS